MKKIVFAAACVVAMAGSCPAMAELSITRQRALTETAADLIESNYVYADKGKIFAGRLRDAAKSYNKPMDEAAFAKSLTERLRTLTGDGHFFVEYQAIAPDKPEDMSFQVRLGPSYNYGFAEVKRLPGNIGYLNLRLFADPKEGGDVAAAAMTLLAQSNALIIDLRENGGGHSEMVMLLASYVFDAPQPMSGEYNRPRNYTTTATTFAWVPGRRFGKDKPVYILTSGHTFSAAEHFAFDLKNAKRATLVGETTGGGAHPSESRALDDHFTMLLPEGRSISPVTGGDWEGVGVIPDMAVPAGQALDKALELAEPYKLPTAKN